MSDALSAFLADHPLVDSIDLLIPDLVGVPRGKRLGTSAIAAALRGEATFTSTIYSLDTTGANVDRSGLVWEEGDADRPLRLDPATLRLTPWAKGRGQIVGGLLDHDGTPFFADTRAALAAVAARFAPFGLRPVAALELEFYLVDIANDADGRPQVAATDRHGGGRPRETEVFLHERMDDEAAFFELVERWCDEQELPYKGALAEFAPGQYEVNLAHADDMLRAADEALVFKRLVKAAARQSGRRATFMAKPFEEQSGSGLHVHLSLVDASGRNVFADGEQGDALLRRCVAGLQRTMPDSMLLLAPNANSYRRFRNRSYAPLAATWGYNNRTVAIRVPSGPPAARRLEHRVAGADANPYLALAAVLAGILDGLTHPGDPGPPATGNAYETDLPPLPSAWETALAAHAGATTLSGWFDPRLWRLYGAGRQAERDRFQARITPTEYEWYLGAV